VSLNILLSHSRSLKSLKVKDLDKAKGHTFKAKDKDKDEAFKAKDKD